MIPNDDPTEEDIWLDLGVLLSFATGSDHVPPVGYVSRPCIEFDVRVDSDLPTASTCGPTLHLPLQLSDPDLFKSKMDFALCNCHGFGVI